MLKARTHASRTVMSGYVATVATMPAKQKKANVPAVKERFASRRSSGWLAL
jgi:hypothetical protein